MCGKKHKKKLSFNKEMALIGAFPEYCISNIHGSISVLNVCKSCTQCCRVLSVTYPQVFDITLRGPKRNKLAEYGVALQNLVAAITGTKR